MRPRAYSNTTVVRKSSDVLLGAITIPAMWVPTTRDRSRSPTRRCPDGRRRPYPRSAERAARDSRACWHTGACAHMRASQAYSHNGRLRGRRGRGHPQRCAALPHRHARTTSLDKATVERVGASRRARTGAVGRASRQRRYDTGKFAAVVRKCSHAVSTLSAGAARPLHGSCTRAGRV